MAGIVEAYMKECAKRRVEPYYGFIEHVDSHAIDSDIDFVPAAQLRILGHVLNSTEDSSLLALRLVRGVRRDSQHAPVKSQQLVSFRKLLRQYGHRVPDAQTCTKLTLAVSHLLRVSPYLQELHLVGIPIGPAGARRLGESLSCAMHLSSVDLGGAAIGDEGAAHLLPPLASMAHLAEVSLSACELTSESAVLLGRLPGSNRQKENVEGWAGSLRGTASSGAALADAGTLRSLDLSHNFLDDDLVDILVKRLTYDISVVSLNLADNVIGARGARQLVSLLHLNSTLQCLDISGNINAVSVLVANAPSARMQQPPPLELVEGCFVHQLVRSGGHGCLLFRQGRASSAGGSASSMARRDTRHGAGRTRVADPPAQKDPQRRSAGAAPSARAETDARGGKCHEEMATDRGPNEDQNAHPFGPSPTDAPPGWPPSTTRGFDPNSLCMSFPMPPPMPYPCYYNPVTIMPPPWMPPPPQPPAGAAAAGALTVRWDGAAWVPVAGPPAAAGAAEWRREERGSTRAADAAVAPVDVAGLVANPIDDDASLSAPTPPQALEHGGIEVEDLREPAAAEGNAGPSPGLADMGVPAAATEDAASAGESRCGEDAAAAGDRSERRRDAEIPPEVQRYFGHIVDLYEEHLAVQSKATEEQLRKQTTALRQLERKIEAMQLRPVLPPKRETRVVLVRQEDHPGEAAAADHLERTLKSLLGNVESQLGVAGCSQRERVGAVSSSLSSPGAMTHEPPKGAARGAPAGAPSSDRSQTAVATALGPATRPAQGDFLSAVSSRLTDLRW